MVSTSATILQTCDSTKSMLPSCCIVFFLLVWTLCHCPAPVLGPSRFPQFQLCLPDFPQPSLHLCALLSLASDLIAIFTTSDFTTARSPLITMMPTSCTFPHVSDNVLLLSHWLPTAFRVFRVHQVCDWVALITPSYLGQSVPTTATWCVIEVLTPGYKPPEVSALRSTHGPCVCHVWRSPRGRKPLGLVVYKPLYFVLKRIRNWAHLSSPHHLCSWSPPTKLSSTSGCCCLAPLVVIVTHSDSCVSCHCLACARCTHRLSSHRVIPLF